MRNVLILVACALVALFVLSHDSSAQGACLNQPQAVAAQADVSVAAPKRLGLLERRHVARAQGERLPILKACLKRLRHPLHRRSGS